MNETTPRDLQSLLVDLASRSVTGPEVSFVLPPSRAYWETLRTEYPGHWISDHPVNGYAKLHVVVGAVPICISMDQVTL